MKIKDALLLRLNEIACTVEHSGHGLAVIALGSVGREINRLDDYSDLDFFVIVETGFKRQYIDNLDWLNSAAPLAYWFRNTPDGYKALFDDGIFCEFAVFEHSELQNIPFAPGRIVWKRSDVDEAIAIPTYRSGTGETRPAEWLLGEALTNLYVGLSRCCRGEKLSAARFVQQFAVDRLIELYELKAKPSSNDKDPFSTDRRLEQRLPELALLLPSFTQGYDRTIESGTAILNYLCAEFPVNAAMESAIRQLLSSR